MRPYLCAVLVLILATGADQQLTSRVVAQQWQLTPGTAPPSEYWRQRRELDQKFERERRERAESQQRAEQERNARLEQERRAREARQQQEAEAARAERERQRQAPVAQAPPPPPAPTSNTLPSGGSERVVIFALAGIIAVLLLVLSMVAKQGLSRAAKVTIAIIVPPIVSLVLFVLGVTTEFTILALPIVGGFMFAFIYSTTSP